MGRLVRDIRFALRRLGKNPGFALIAVVSLALGIGANTAIFTVVNAVLLRRSPMPEPARVLDISTRTPDYPLAPLSYVEYRELRDATPAVFEQISWSTYGLVVRELGNRTTTLTAELVNGDYFPLLGVRAWVGRLLGRDDDVAPGASPVVVLSFDYWQEAFGGSPGVVGAQLRLAGRPYTIVGVAPASYTGSIRGLAPAVYLPMQMVNQVEPAATDQLRDRTNHNGFVKARLAPGVSQARARVATASFQQLEQREHPEEWGASRSLRMVPMSQVAVNPLLDGILQTAAVLIMGLVGLVLLIACANLASFLLAQARDRQREIAIRVALGAGRGDVVRQLLSETLVLAGLGGAAGVALARGLLDVLVHTDLPLPLPIRLDLPMDARVLLFGGLVSALAALLFGLAPALQATRTGVADAIKSENVGGGPGGWRSVRDALVVGQVAISLVLFIAAGLFLRSLLALRSTNPGWGDRPAALVDILLPGDRYPGPKAGAFLDRAVAELAALPGVERVGYTSLLPLDPTNKSAKTINVPGLEPPRGETGFSVAAAAVDAGFLAAAGIPIVRGRNFGPGDVRGAPRVAVITEATARRFWPGRNPIGEVFRTDSGEVHVIGIARDIKVGSLGEPPRPYLMLAAAQNPIDMPVFVLGTRGDPQLVVPGALAALRRLDPDLPVFRALTVDRYLAMLRLPARLAALVVGAFAALALVLAVIGVWGVVRYAVARRAREVAIRMALGADARSVVRLLMRHGTSLVATGAALGLLLGLAGARLMRSLLFGISPFDPLTFAGVTLLLLAVGALAAFLPARRVGALDPASVLRSE